MGDVLRATAGNTQDRTTVDERSRCAVHHRRRSPARRLPDWKRFVDWKTVQAPWRAVRAGKVSAPGTAST